MKPSLLALLSTVTMLSLGCSSTAADVPDAAADGGAADGALPTAPGVSNGRLGTQAIDVSQVVLAPNLKYRLVVAFTQFDDDYAPTPVDIALDVPFDVGAKTVDLSAIRPPAPHTVFCPRKDKKRGEAPGPCDADAAYHVAIGYLVIVKDGNDNGKADFGTSGGDARAPLLAPDAQAGIAIGAVLYDATSGSILQAGADGKPILIDGAVPKGFSIYEAYRPAGSGVFDRLRPPSAPLKFATKGPNLT